MSYLAVQGISVVFRQFRLENVGFELDRGETLAILGPSGAGKSVLLETIAGFHPVIGGRIKLGGIDITALPPERRSLGFMFQDYALFPHMSVEENVAFGVKGGQKADRRVVETLDMVGARHLVDRRPTTLSGGEKQRVALARALAIDPRLFIFDEPLSALDAATREQLREELRRLLRALKATSLYVTHDRTEALMLGDRIAIMEGGRIRQIGAPREVFDHPADAWVAGFLGMQLLRPVGLEPLGFGRVRARLDGGSLEVASTRLPRAGKDCLAFRAEEVHLERRNGQQQSDQNGLPAMVESVVPLGPLFRIDLAAGGLFSALLTRREHERLGLEAGDVVLATVEPRSLLLLADDQPESGPPTGRQR